MKKLIAITLTLLLVLSLAACGGNSSSNTTDGNNDMSSTTTPPADSTPPVVTTPEPEPTPTVPEDDSKNDDDSSSDDNPTDTEVLEGQAMASLIQWMMDGTFSFDFTMIMDGPEGKTEGSGSMAIDGNDFALSQEMTVEGTKVKSRIIQKDGKMYMVDDENQFIMELPVEMFTEGMMTDYTGITLVGSGTGEINGKTLPYEEYLENEMGSTVKYFLDGDEVYGMVSEFEGYTTTMIITNSSNRVPSGVFDLPEGYSKL